MANWERKYWRIFSSKWLLSHFYEYTRVSLLVHADNEAASLSLQGGLVIRTWLSVQVWLTYPNKEGLVIRTVKDLRINISTDNGVCNEAIFTKNKYRLSLRLLKIWIYSSLLCNLRCTLGRFEATSFWGCPFVHSGFRLEGSLEQSWKRKSLKVEYGYFLMYIFNVLNSVLGNFWLSQSHVQKGCDSNEVGHCFPAFLVRGLVKEQFGDVPGWILQIRRCQF